MVIYKRKKGSDTWHWCKNCSRYPSGPDVETKTTRPSYDLCNECKSKEREGSCRT